MAKAVIESQNSYYIYSEHAVTSVSRITNFLPPYQGLLQS